MSQLGRFRRLLGLGRSEERRQTRRMDARKGIKVLVIDDSRTVVAALSHMLRQSGYVPIGAGDGEKGLTMAVSEQPDLIFLDIVLPGLNGFAALRRLRKDSRTASIPVIMISGNPQAAEKFYLERIGADDFMKKPFGRAEVFTRIEKLVREGSLPPRSQSAPIEPAASVEQSTEKELRISDDMHDTQDSDSAMSTTSTERDSNLDEASSPDMPDSAIKHQPSSKEARESLSPFDSDNRFRQS